MRPDAVEPRAADRSAPQERSEPPSPAAGEAAATGVPPRRPADPTVPRPLAPVRGALVDASAAAFEWTPVEGAENYEVAVAEDADFQREIAAVDAGGPTTSLTLYGTLAPDDDRDLYWRVRAAGRGAWSAPASFRAATDEAVAAYRAEQDRRAAERAREEEERRAARQAEIDRTPDYEHDTISSTQVAVLLATLAVSFVVLAILLLFIGQVEW
ncbi:MAG: hypothetical protein R3362_00275 [Rhodothermales bacterium]|nr:hypothetical protein [Rhodothermales bacterium]